MMWKHENVMSISVWFGQNGFFASKPESLSVNSIILEFVNYCYYFIITLCWFSRLIQSALLEGHGFKVIGCPPPQGCLSSAETIFIYYCCWDLAQHRALSWKEKKKWVIVQGQPIKASDSIVPVKIIWDLKFSLQSRFESKIPLPVRWGGPPAPGGREEDEGGRDMDWWAK